MAEWLAWTAAVWMVVDLDNIEQAAMSAGSMVARMDYCLDGGCMVDEKEEGRAARSVSAMAGWRRVSLSVAWWAAWSDTKAVARAAAMKALTMAVKVTDKRAGSWELR